MILITVINGTYEHRTIHFIYLILIHTRMNTGTHWGDSCGDPNLVST